MAKQIAINQLEKLLDENMITFPMFEGDEDSPVIEIKRTLSLEEMWRVVDEVVEMCYPLIDVGTEENPRQERIFMPENRDFAFRKVVLSHYANFRLPTDFAKQYDLAYRTNAFGMVIEHVNQDQLREIMISADRKVEFMKESQMSAASLLKGVVDRFLKSVNNLGDIDSESIQKALALLNDTKKAGDKVVKQAIMDATQESDANTGDDQDGKIVYLTPEK